MIVHHKVGEATSGLMSQQYRPVFNAVGAGVGVLAGGLSWLLWFPLLWFAPMFVFAVVYGVNLVGRLAAVPVYELKKPTKDTENEILELQDIYFHMPKEHKDKVAKLLEGAYAQISRGNIDAVQPRVQEARKLRGEILKHNALTDSMEDVKSVQAEVQSMNRAITAG